MNKRLIGIFIALVAVVLIVVLSFVVFTIGEISVETASDIFYSQEQSAKIILDSNIIPRGSIFGISKDIATKNIESKNPNIRVISILRKVPNRVVINITGRIAIISIAMQNGQYASVDRDLKVIEISNTIPEDLTQLKGITISGETQKGEFLKDLDWVSNLANSAKNLSFLDKRFSTFFEEILYDADTVSNNVQIKTNSGVVLVLNTIDTGKLLGFAYNYYLNMTTELQKESGYIILNNEAWGWKNEM